MYANRRKNVPTTVKLNYLKLKWQLYTSPSIQHFGMLTTKYLCNPFGIQNMQQSLTYDTNQLIRVFWKDPGIDRKTILKRILQQQVGRCGLIRLRTETNGRMFWTRQYTKSAGDFLLGQELSTSEGDDCCFVFFCEWHLPGKYLFDSRKRIYKCH
jgi:hypothetical protein